MNSDAKANLQNIGSTERMIAAFGGSALALYGLVRRDLGGVLLAAAGGYVVYRGIRGSSPEYRLLGLNTAQSSYGQSGVKVEKQVTINKDVDTIYRFWRNFENLPRFMKHLEAVSVTGDRHSHWVAKAPAGTTVSWDAEIVEDSENERISWRSMPGSEIQNAGEVRFVALPYDRGTEIHVVLTYEPPAGALGAVIAKLFGEEPNQQVEGDLRRLKNLLEAGEIPTISGQSSGRDEQTPSEHSRDTGKTPQKPDQLGPKSAVSKALEDTFPASDPVSPAQTPDGPKGVETQEQQVGLGRKIY